jgi:hypothetical protein
MHDAYAKNTPPLLRAKDRSARSVPIPIPLKKPRRQNLIHPLPAKSERPDSITLQLTRGQEAKEAAARLLLLRADDHGLARHRSAGRALFCCKRGVKGHSKGLEDLASFTTSRTDDMFCVFVDRSLPLLFSPHLNSDTLGDHFCCVWGDV